MDVVIKFIKLIKIPRFKIKDISILDSLGIEGANSTTDGNGQNTSERSQNGQLGVGGKPASIKVSLLPVAPLIQILAVAQASSHVVLLPFPIYVLAAT